MSLEDLSFRFAELTRRLDALELQQLGYRKRSGVRAAYLLDKNMRLLRELEHSRAVAAKIADQLAASTMSAVHFSARVASPQDAQRSDIDRSAYHELAQSGYQLLRRAVEGLPHPPETLAQQIAGDIYAHLARSYGERIEAWGNATREAASHGPAARAGGSGTSPPSEASVEAHGAPRRRPLRTRKLRMRIAPPAPRAKRAGE